MDISGIKVEEKTSGILVLDLIEPNGLYDNVEVKIDLISTNSMEYLLDPKQVLNNCQEFSRILNITHNIIAESIKFENICPMSTYKIQAKTNKKGFKPEESIKTINSSKLKI